MSNLAGPTTHLPAVCNGNGVVNSTYSGKTNLAIAKLVSVYFVAPPSSLMYQDVWAQETVLNSGGPRNPDVVPAIDGLMPTMFTCSNWAQSYYYDFGEPPPANSYPTGCPQVNPSSFQ